MYNAICTEDIDPTSFVQLTNFQSSYFLSDQNIQKISVRSERIGIWGLRIGAELYRP